MNTSNRTQRDTPDEQTAIITTRLGEALSSKDWPGALTLLQALERLVPEQASIAYNTGLVLKRLGRIDESAVSLNLALNRDSAHLDALFELAALDMDRGNLLQAEHGFRRYLTGRPRDVDALLNLGNLLIALRRPQEAIVTLQPMFTEHPTADLAIALAIALRDAGDHDGCRSRLDRLPGTPEFAAIRLKILSQGARGRLPINARQLLPAAR